MSYFQGTVPSHVTVGSCSKLVRVFLWADEEIYYQKKISLSKQSFFLLKPNYKNVFWVCSTGFKIEVGCLPGTEIERLAFQMVADQSSF